MAVVFSNLFNLVELNDLIGAGGLLHSVSMGLFTNNVSLTPLTTLADLGECVAPGIGTQVITWLTPYLQPDGSWAVNSQILEFAMSDNTDPQSAIYGYFVSTTTSIPQLLYSELFPVPEALATDQEALQISTQVVTGGTSNGDGVVIS